MSNISIAPLLTTGVKSKYIVIDAETGSFYSVSVKDGGVLPDGHPHKTMAVAMQTATTLKNAMIVLLSSTGFALNATVVGMIADGELAPPHPEMLPITLLSKTEWGTWIFNSGFDSGLGNVFRTYMKDTVICQ